MSTIIDPAPADDTIDYDTELAEIAGILNAQHGRLVTLVEAAINDGEWQQSGLHTPAQWLALHTGLSPHRAREIVACAQRRRDMPHVHAKLASGELSLDQTVATNRAPAWADEHVADFASVLTVSQLRTTITKQFFDEPEPANQPADEPAPEPVDERLSTRVDGDGRWRISGSGDLDHGAIIDAALTEAKDALFQRGDTDATWFDALVEISQRSLDTIDSPARRDRYRTWIHLDTERHAASTIAGQHLPTPLRDLLGCDATIAPVWETNGVPFSVGRNQRIVPDRTRRIIEHRDHGCRVPGCTTTRHVEIHHIIHWNNGGPTDTSNLISLCPRHHRDHHHNQLGITGNPNTANGITFTNHNGQPLPTAATPTTPPRPPPTPTHRYQHPTGEHMNYRYFTGWVHPDLQHQRRQRHRRS